MTDENHVTLAHRRRRRRRCDYSEPFILLLLCLTATNQQHTHCHGCQSPYLLKQLTTDKREPNRSPCSKLGKSSSRPVVAFRSSSTSLPGGLLFELVGRHRRFGSQPTQTTKYISMLKTSPTNPFSTKSTTVSPNNRIHNSNDRELVLRRNQRLLPRRILPCRGDARRALEILIEAYPHLALPSFPPSSHTEQKNIAGHATRNNIADHDSLDFLRRILDNRNKSNETRRDNNIDTNLNGDEPSLVIIDGKSISAAMEVLRKAGDVPTALHLLRLSVDGVQSNRHVRRTRQRQLHPHPLPLPLDDRTPNADSRDDIEDDNELRQIYKSAISLLGNLPSSRSYSKNERPGSTATSPTAMSEFLLWILDHHMPGNDILPEAEMYHAAMNALGKCGAYRDVILLLERMERSRESGDIHTGPNAHEIIHGASKKSSSVRGNGTVTQSLRKAPPVDRMAYQTAIASLSKSGYSRTATQLLPRMRSKGFPPDIGCYEALLVGIAKEAGRNASRVSENTDNTTAKHYGDWIAKSNNDTPLHKVALQILQDMEMEYENGNSGVKPTDQSYNSVISACGKEGAWDEVTRVSRKEAISRSSSGDDMAAKKGRLPTNIFEPKNSMPSYFQDLGCYRKVGKGKDSWWEIGRYSIMEYDSNADYDGNVINQPITDGNVVFESNIRPKCGEARSIIIGLQPHRNPVRNGISLVFYDEDSRVKLGRMLLKNSSSKQDEGTAFSDAAAPSTLSRSIFFSSIIGMEVNKSRRGEGLSKIFIAIWLRICLETDAFPRAAVMNKPLISLVLQRFGFVPQDGGVSVELIRLERDYVIDLSDRKSRDNQPNHPVGEGTESRASFGLYSPHAKSLQGIFSQRVLRTQNIAILDRLPNMTSERTSIHLKTTFEHPISIEANVVEYNPPRGVYDSNNCEISTEQRRSMLNDSFERQKLEYQINDVLKTGKYGGNDNTYGLMEFFSSSSMLRNAFLSFACRPEY